MFPKGVLSYVMHLADVINFTPCFHINIHAIYNKIRWTFTNNVSKLSILVTRYLSVVDGGYSDWEEWTPCSRTCSDGSNSGTQTRTRRCDHPPPSAGGLDCSRLGSPTDTQWCNQNLCPGKNFHWLWQHKRFLTFRYQSSINWSDVKATFSRINFLNICCLNLQLQIEICWDPLLFDNSYWSSKCCRCLEFYYKNNNNRISSCKHNHLFLIEILSL